MSLLGFTCFFSGFFWVVIDFTVLCWVKLDYFFILLNMNKFCLLVKPDFTVFYWM